MALPATNTSAPAARARCPLSGPMPPSTSIRKFSLWASRHAAAARHLVEHQGHERLAAEARLDGHDQQQVHVLQQLLGRHERRARLDRETGARFELADPAENLGGPRARLEVHGELIGAGPAELPDQAFGMLDHQVHVEERVGQLIERRHHQRAEREIGHEVVVHHVAMQPVARGVHDGRGFGQAREVRGQDAGRGDRGGGCHERARRSSRVGVRAQSPVPHGATARRPRRVPSRVSSRMK